MSDWVESTRITYKRWRDPEMSEGSFQRGELTGGPNSGDPSPEPEVHSGDREHGSRAESNHSQDVLSVQDCVDTLGFGRFQVKLSMLTGVSSMADAMETMLLSILGPQLLCEWRLETSFQVALLTAAVFLGMAISSPFWGNVCDKYGRKTGLMMSVVWTLYYGLLSALAPTLGWMLVLRGLVGVGIGGAPQAFTLYSEFLPRKSRALYIVLVEALYSVGAVVAVVLAMLIMPALGWRWLLGAAALPLLLYIGSYSWLPESAHFDLQAGNRDAAVATLKRIAAENGKVAPAGRLMAGHQRERGRLRDLLSPACLKTTLLLWAIWFALAFSYSGIVLLTPALLQEGDACQATHRASTDPDCSLKCHYLTQDDYEGLLLTTLAEFPGLLVTLLAVERIGRKKSMALCLVLFSVSTLPLFGCIGRTALTTFIFLARASISGGLQVVYVYTPEVFPTESRALGLGTCSTMARLAALLAPFLSQGLTSTSLPAAVALYCCCSLLAAWAAMSLPLETTGLETTGQETTGQETTGQETTCQALPPGDHRPGDHRPGSAPWRPPAGRPPARLCPLETTGQETTGQALPPGDHRPGDHRPGSAPWRPPARRPPARLCPLETQETTGLETTCQALPPGDHLPGSAEVSPPDGRPTPSRTSRLTTPDSARRPRTAGESGSGMNILHI